MPGLFFVSGYPRKINGATCRHFSCARVAMTTACEPELGGMVGSMSDPQRSFCDATLRVADSKRALSASPGHTNAVPGVECFTRRNGCSGRGGGGIPSKTRSNTQPSSNPLKKKTSVFPHLVHPTGCPFSVPLSVVGDGSGQTSLSVLCLRQAASASSVFKPIFDSYEPECTFRKVETPPSPHGKNMTPHTAHGKGLNMSPRGALCFVAGAFLRRPQCGAPAGCDIVPVIEPTPRNAPARATSTRGFVRIG